MVEIMKTEPAFVCITEGSESKSSMTEKNRDFGDRKKPVFTCCGMTLACSIYRTMDQLRE